MSTKDANWSFNQPETVEIDDLGPISYEPVREHNQVSGIVQVGSNFTSKL